MRQRTKPSRELGFGNLAAGELGPDLGGGKDEVVHGVCLLGMIEKRTGSDIWESHSVVRRC